MADKLIELIEITKKLKEEVDYFLFNLESYHEIYHINETSPNNFSSSRNRLLKKKETVFDQVHEKYMKCVKTLESENVLTSLIDDFIKNSEDYFYEQNNRKEEMGNKLNDILDEAKEIEMETKANSFSHMYEKLNYNEMKIETEKYKTIKEVQEQKRKEDEMRIKITEEYKDNRYEKVNKYLTKDEMISFENEIGRCVNEKVFDSNTDIWTKGFSTFYVEIQNKSNIIIFIQTKNGKKFGCYIQNMINMKGKYISDPNAFLFTIANNSIEKYPIKDNDNAIKICDNKDEDLVIIGKNDIVIKKKEKKNKCSCTQKSFDYHGKENVLIGQKGNFEIESIIVIDTNEESDINREIENKLVEIIEEERKMKQQEEQKLIQEKQQKKQEEARIMKEKIERRKEEERKKAVKQSCYQRYTMNQIHQFIDFEEYYSLEQLSGMNCGEVLFDSNVDNWSVNTSVLNERITGKKQLAFIIESEDGEIFGYYLNTEIFKNVEYSKFMKTNSKTFHFNLESKGRFNGPKRFNIRDVDYGYVLHDKTIHLQCGRPGFDLWVGKIP